MKKKNFEFLTHARHDPILCGIPGLFRCFKKQDQKKIPLRLFHATKSYKVEIRGPELLGAQELRVLQSLVSIAGPEGEILNLGNPSTNDGEYLAKELYPTGVGVIEDAIVIRGSFYKLAQLIGYKSPRSGTTIALIRESMERLWYTSLVVEKNSIRSGYRFLSVYGSNNKTGGFIVALNPSIARAITGKRYTRIELNESRSLHKQQAVIIHQRLCSFINAGRKHPKSIKFNTFSAYVWHDSAVKAGSSSERKRKQTIRKAFVELRNAGWSVDEVGKDRFIVGRPAIGVTDSTAL